MENLNLSIQLRENRVIFMISPPSPQRNYEYKFSWAPYDEDQVDLRQKTLIKDFDSSLSAKWEITDFKKVYYIIIEVKEGNAIVGTKYFEFNLNNLYQEQQKRKLEIVERFKSIFDSIKYNLETNEYKIILKENEENLMLKLAWVYDNGGEVDYKNENVIQNFSRETKGKWNPPKQIGKYIFILHAKNSDGIEITISQQFELKLESYMCGIEFDADETHEMMKGIVKGNTKGYKYKFMYVEKSKPEKDAVLIKGYDELDFVKWTPRDFNKEYEIYFYVKNSDNDEGVISRPYPKELLKYFRKTRGVQEPLISLDTERKNANFVDITPGLVGNVNKKELKYIKVHEGVTEIKKDDFREFTNLEIIEFPQSITKIEDESFKECHKLRQAICEPKWLRFLKVKEYIVPEYCKVIKRKDLNGAEHIQKIFIPLSVKNIEPYCFCDFHDIYFVESDPLWSNDFDKDSIVNFIIPDGVDKIPEMAFRNYISLDNITIPDSVQSVGNRAFMGCRSLKIITIPQTVNDIRPNTFAMCPNLKTVNTSPEVERKLQTSLVIKEGRENLTFDDFKGYENITRIEIPLSVKSIDPSIFRIIKKVKEVKCHPKWIQYFNRELLELIEIPEGVQIIENQTLNNCQYLDCLIIPSSVIYIEDDLSKILTTLTCLKCNTQFLYQFNKEKLRTLCVDESTEIVKKNEIEGCIHLENLFIPNPNTIIEDNAFYCCKGLINIKCDKKWENRWNSIFNVRKVISDDVQEVDKSEFSEWINLDTLIINTHLNKIDKGTFDNCRYIETLKCESRFFDKFHKEYIKHLIIDEGCTHITKEMLKQFPNAEIIELPDSVVTIDRDAFDDCEKLKYYTRRDYKYDITREKEQIYDRYVGNISAPNYNFERSSFTRGREDPNDFSSSSSSSSLSDSSDDDFEEEKTIIPKRKLHPKPKETTVKDLIVFDQSNIKYEKSLYSILAAIQRRNYSENFEANSKDVSNIARVVASIYHRIYWSNEVKHVNNFRICPRPGQVLAVLRLADELINGKGAIGEIKTGEGKSFIIAVLSIVLYFYGRKVDIVTSSLELAKRDESNHRMYYALFNIDTGVLFDTKNEFEFMEGSRFVTDNSPEKVLCGFNTNVFDCPIVYSTNGNYEFVYLNSLYRKSPLRNLASRPYDVVIVDEVDSMFIDQESSPSIIAKKASIANERDILEIIYLMRENSVNKIIETLERFFPECGHFDEKIIKIVKRAAHQSQSFEKDVHYIILDNKVVLMDKFSGYPKPDHRFQGFIHEMIEIKENVPQNPSGLTLCGITQRGYFKLFKGIAGLTGTIGSEEDQRHLKNVYGVNIFKVPRHFETRKIITQKKRKFSVNEIFADVFYEIQDKVEKGMPVLVIMDSKKNADLFYEFTGIPNLINGIDVKSDRIFILQAGVSKTMTIATSVAGRGVDIKPDKKALEAGGLHVIIPMLMPNQRALEQAAGRSGRQDQPGSVSIYTTDFDAFYSIPLYRPAYDNFAVIEIRFSNFLKDNLSWIYNGTNSHTLKGMLYPFNATFDEVLEIAGKRMLQLCDQEKEENVIDAFTDLIRDMIITSWAVMLTEIHYDMDEYKTMDKCDAKYDEYLNELRKWIDESCTSPVKAIEKIITDHAKREDWGNYVISAGIKILSAAGCLSSPVISPYILSAGDEVYTNPKTGGLDWAFILEMLGDFEKYGIVVGDKPGIRHGFSYFTPSEEEYYLYGIWCGESHEKARKIGRWMMFKKGIPNFSHELVLFCADLCQRSYQKMLGFEDFNLLDARQVDTYNKPYYYIISYNGDIYVVIRGTNSIFDVMSDAYFIEESVDLGTDVINIHSGFYKSALSIVEHIKSRYRYCLGKIIITGHSYGAAVASVLTTLLTQSRIYKDNQISCICFAPPPSMSYCPYTSNIHIASFVNKDDIVPRLSYSNIQSDAFNNPIQNISLLPILATIDLIVPHKKRSEVTFVSGTVFHIGVGYTKYVDCIIFGFNSYRNIPKLSIDKILKYHNMDGDGGYCEELEKLLDIL